MHWSSRPLARHLGVSDFTVSTTWKKWDLQPWRVGSFTFSTDPELEAKIRDVVGLYLNPPERAIVLLRGRAEPDPGAGPDHADPPATSRHPGEADPRLRPARHYDPVAALEVATGKVTDACYQRHRNEAFLHFLKHVAKTYSRRRLHIVCGNYATHKHPNVTRWLAQHPRITLHFTPTSGSG